MDALLSVYPPSVFSLRVHAFPLPYHTWSFIANQGLYVIDYHSSSSSSPSSSSHLRDYIHLLFQIQSNYWNAITAKKNRIDISHDLAKDVITSGKFPSSLTTKEFVEGLKNEDLDMATREGWKYSAWRGVVGTPQWLINGVAVNDADATWGETEWKRLIDGLRKEKEKADKKRKAKKE